MSDLVKHIRAIIKYVETGEQQDGLCAADLDGTFFPLLGQCADEIERLRTQLASARKAVEETESYRLALAWIEGQSTDPKAREIATDALQCAETDEQGK